MGYALAHISTNQGINMKPVLQAFAASALMVFLTGLSLAQETVTTQSGRTVTLNPNGTWSYVAVAPVSSAGASKRTENATSKVELGRTGYSFYFDPEKWLQKPNDPDGKMIFVQKTGGDIYGMIISERIQAGADNLVKLALQNAKAVAPDAKITYSATKVVNGFPVRVATIQGNTQGIGFVYHSYYFSGKGGMVQVVTYTGANLFEESKPEMEEFLNGFVGGL